MAIPNLREGQLASLEGSIVRAAEMRTTPQGAAILLLRMETRNEEPYTLTVTAMGGLQLLNGNVTPTVHMQVQIPESAG